jgi:hypothetical protein
MPANHKGKVLPLLPLLIFISSAMVLAQQTTSFTYQGRLIDGGTPANGNYDFQFGLWDSLSGGTQIGSALTISPVSVTNGSYTVQLDFGAAAFPGANRFLEMSVRPTGGGSYTPLSPRQPITSVPYAVRALNATNVSSTQVSVDGATGNVNTNGNVTVNGSVTTGTLLSPGGGGISVNSSLNTTGDLRVGGPGKFLVEAATGNVTVGGTVQLSFPPAAPGGSPTLCINNGVISTCNSSSARYKKNILNLGAGLDIVSKLRPITFSWKEGGQPDLGLIAEEVNSIEPLLVTYNAKGQIEGVKYDRLNVVLVNAVQQQQAQIRRQQQEITLQQTEIQNLKQLVCRSHRRASICK